MTTRVLKLAPFFCSLAIATPAFAEEGHGVATQATPLFKIGPLPVTNSMVMTWIVAVALVVVIRIVAGRPKLVPSRGQALVEDMVGGIKEIVAPVIGKTAINAALPLLIGLFVYILIQNWSGLIPGVGTILMHANGEWHEFVRPAHADMNGTIALTLCAFFAGIFLVLRYAGPKTILFDLFGNKASKQEVPAPIYYPLSLIFFAVGFLELVSIFFARPVSLSFRLFGNIFGGENLIHSMSSITPWAPWVLPIPFYFMELLVGIVQAFVFALLIAVYIGLLTNHGDGHAHEGEGHPGAKHGSSPH